MPSAFSCFGRIFKRRKNMKISAPMETTPPLSVKTPNLSKFGAQASSGPRSPNLVYSNNNSRGSIISRRPNVTNSNPTISVTTPGATPFPLTSPQVPNFFTKSSSSSTSQEEIYLTDEKKNSSSSEFPRTPGTFDFDATPRIHRVFKILSPPPTKLTFTEAVRPEPVIEPRKSMASRISKRLSRRWTGKNVNFDNTNTNISVTSPPTPRNLGNPRSTPEMCYSPQYIPRVSYETSLPSSPRVYTTPLSPPPIPSSLPPSARNGLGQCLTTRLPNGEVKPVTMVPQLKLSVPMISRVQAFDATPIEASPVCDPWGHRKEEIEGMSDRHQAWLL
ncbi:uncharacterized protein DFL_009822 [Arthrobotrys flagrans]|uniref:Uncharacterized protein n=1 Tax=Arthrobotrys flagrans TaxID=97331 RepID=A0A436ZSX3_ARTFL|nr:hypothetical protein DFL_009822 [Arthrobotrys flagrans]